jgi:uncharacterized membrane protein
MFDSLVNLTEPICQSIDNNLASMTISDTSGIKAYVQENNPKFINALIKGKQHMVRYQLTSKLTLLSSKCISMVTSAIPTNSVLLQTDLILFEMLIFMMKINTLRIPKFKFPRKMILRMKIKIIIRF